MMMEMILKKQKQILLDVLSTLASNNFHICNLFGVLTTSVDESTKYKNGRIGEKTFHLRLFNSKHSLMALRILS